MRMTKTPYRLGLDIGSTTVKAVVLDPDSGKSEGDIIDEITGQMKLF